jgi:LPS sulfotransferase NodH
MLGHALGISNQFGFPFEYANPVNTPGWQKRFGTNRIGAILEEIKKLRTSPKGVFSIKLHYSHLKTVGGLEGLEHHFPNAYFVLLTRKNLLWQAISMSIAKQTGVWISGQKPTNENHQYRFKEIDNCLREIVLETAAWRYFLAATGYRFIELSYDEIRNHLSASIQKIGDFMGVEIPPAKIPKRHATIQQKDNKKFVYMKSFLREHRGAELLDEPKTSIPCIPVYKARILKQNIKRKIERFFGH